MLREPKFKIGDLVIARGPAYAYAGEVTGVWLNGDPGTWIEESDNMYCYAIWTQDSSLNAGEEPGIRGCTHEDVESKIEFQTIEMMKLFKGGNSE